MAIDMENMKEEIEDQKIQYERQKTDLLRNLEQDKRNMFLKIKTDAEKDLDMLRSRLEAERQT